MYQSYCKIILNHLLCIYDQQKLFFYTLQQAILYF